jgi:alkylhydroperoxidase family enzyme
MWCLDGGFCWVDSKTKYAHAKCFDASRVLLTTLNAFTPKDLTPMSRILPLEFSSSTPDQQLTLRSIEAGYGTATNMKRTLARSPVTLHALLQWYPLRDEVKVFLGERGITLFCHAISTGSTCLLCSTYFRRELIDAGEDPTHLVIAEPLAAVVDYGAALATNPNGIDDALWSRLTAAFDDTQLVALTAFGTLMIATNVFNNALRIDLDESLLAYNAREAQHG